MLAVIRTGGKQYKVKEGEVLEVEKLEAKEGEEVEIKEVLLVADDKEVKIGTPLVSEVLIKAKVLSQLKGPKVIVFKYKPKKRYRKKTSHRQKLTRLLIEEIKEVKTSKPSPSGQKKAQKEAKSKAKKSF